MGSGTRALPTNPSRPYSVPLSSGTLFGPSLLLLPTQSPATVKFIPCVFTFIFLLWVSVGFAFWYVSDSVCDSGLVIYCNFSHGYFMFCGIEGFKCCLSWIWRVNSCGVLLWFLCVICYLWPFFRYR